MMLWKGDLIKRLVWNHLIILKHKVYDTIEGNIEKQAQYLKL